MNLYLLLPRFIRIFFHASHKEVRKKIIIFHQCSCSLLTCFGWVYPFQYSGLENSMGLQGVGHNWATFTTFTWVSLGMFGGFFFFFFLLVCFGLSCTWGCDRCAKMSGFLFLSFPGKKTFVNNRTFSLLTFFLLPLLSKPNFFLNSLFKKLYFSKSKKKFGWTYKLTIRRSTSKGKGPMLTNSFKYMHVAITLSLAE